MSVSGTTEEPATSVALLENVDGELTPGEQVELGFQPRALELGDVNGDGQQDLVALLGNTAAVVMEAAGGGSFALRAPFNVGEGVIEIALLDADDSGTLDLVAADLSTDAIYLARDLSGSDAVEFLKVPAPYDIAAFRGNGDAKLDLVTTSVDGASVIAFLTNEEGQYARTTLVAVEGATRLGGIAAADFDGDGLDDLVLVERGREPGRGTLHFLLSGQLPTR